ncbi:hypothetical protein I79_016269 [Cricetulus griseus]|uniref:Uncharacterized protein n=1 Tax=Cricetulus griseus TaxID=10029 RepID=G3HYX6_CRIGR|nr:hypothetical protein I79_016269 [Cricetulus griseus]
MIQPHRLLQPGLETSPALSHYAETGQQMIQLALPALDNFPIFSESLKDAIASRQQEVTF